MTYLPRRARPCLWWALLFGAFAWGCRAPTDGAGAGSLDTHHDTLATPSSPADPDAASAHAPPDASTAPAPPSPPADPDAAVVVASAGHITLTLADLRAAIRRAELFGQPLRAHALADPMQQRLLIDQLLRRALLLEEAAALGLPAPTRAEQRAYLRRVPALAPLADLPPWSLPLRLAVRAAALPAALPASDWFTAADLWAITTEALTADRLTQHLLSRVTDDDLWERYRALHTRAQVEVVRLLNVPSPQELSRFVREHHDEIVRRYDAQRARYTTPARAHLWTLTRAIPPDATPLEVEAIRQEAEALRQRARVEDLTALARTHSDDPLSAPLGGRLPPVTEAQNPDAFKLPIGQPGEVLRRRNHFYFLVLESITPAQDRPLDLGLERELASALLRERGPSPSVAAAALDILRQWRAAPDAPFPPPPGSPLAALLAKHSAQPLPLADLPLDPSAAHFPDLGHRAALHAAVMSLSPDQPFPDAPILDGDSFFVARLVRRQDASRTRFNADLPLFRDQTRAHLAPRILHQHLSARAAALTSTIYVNLRPVQARYGSLQRDGSIAYPSAAEP